MSVEIRVSPLGESVTNATVARWLKRRGESVNADEPLFELKTDKVTFQALARFPGVFCTIDADVGAEVEFGTLMCRIEADATTQAPPKPQRPAPAAEAP
jgi:2-oxoglutarate dehydrogenase E2 component (dihydrolipoamide succinyltransferase)